MNHQQLYAYALGYHQGRVVGQFEYSGWETMNMVEQYAFREGYERGVTDYCEYDSNAEEYFSASAADELALGHA